MSAPIWHSKARPYKYHDNSKNGAPEGDTYEFYARKEADSAYLKWCVLLGLERYDHPERQMRADYGL